MALRLTSLAALLLITTSAFSQEFVYPVGNPDERPTLSVSNANGYRVTNGFREGGHTGVDLANGSTGGNVRSIGPGTVTMACEGYCYGFGNVALIRHNLSGGPFYSLYAHMLDGSLRVAVGDTVTAGQRIGQVGNTGHSFGAHLHFSVKTRNQLGCGYIIAGSCNSEWGQESIYEDPLAFIASNRDGGSSGPLNYNELADGDIPGTYGSGPVFQLAVGTNVIVGNGNSSDLGTLPGPGAFFDFDIFSIVVPSGRSLRSIRLENWGFQYPQGRVFFRVRPCAQPAFCAYGWSVTGNESNTTPESIAAEISAIPRSLPEYTFNNSGNLVEGGVPYRWTFVVE